MHTLINQADVENGLMDLNDLYGLVANSIPQVYRHLTNNVTTPLLLEICLRRDGISLPLDWCKRVATIVSYKHKLPIPDSLVLKDSELFAFLFISRTMGW